MDRNNGRLRAVHNAKVALRKESVDRNSTGLANLTVSTTSLSARRAWIEISTLHNILKLFTSLSARRAWIEIEAPTERANTHARRSPQGERG